MTTASYSIVNVRYEYDAYISTLDYPLDESEASLTAIAGGGFALSYTVRTTQTTPVSWSVRSEIYDTDGNYLNGHYWITNPQGYRSSDSDSSLTQLTNGQLLTTWTTLAIGSTAQPGLHYGILDTDGTVVLEDAAIPDTNINESESDVAALLNGGFVVASERYYDSTNFNSQIHIFNADGVNIANPVLGVAGSTSHELLPSVAVLTNGNIAVSYQEEQSDGSGTYSMAVEIYSPSGTQIKEQTIFDSVGSQNITPDVAALKDGGFVVAYQDDGLGEAGVTLAFFTAEGTFRGAVRTYNDTLDQSLPAVSVLANGFVAVTWTSGPSTARDIVSTVVDPTSLTRIVAPYFTEDQYGPQGNPSAAGLTDGTQITAWTDVMSFVDDGNTDTHGTHMALQIDAVVRNTVGDSSNEVFRGDQLRDQMTGGGGDDTFVYARGGNADTISDFAAGTANNDRIFLLGFPEVRSFADVMDRATQSGANTVISFGGTDQLTLTNVLLNSLTSDNFRFSAFGSTSLAVAAFGASSGAGGWSNDDTFHRTLADVNGDGRGDIIGFGYSSTLVSLANGSGGFNAPIIGVESFGYSPAGGGWGSNNYTPRTAADVSGDGLADIIGFGYGGTYVSLATAGGQFASPIMTSGTFGSSAGAGGWSDNNFYHRDVADVNGDGMADIVGFGYDGTYVALATGGGNFAAAKLASTTFGASAAAGGWSDDSVYHRELADVNGDGMADIVGFGSDTTYVALATGGGNFAPAIPGIAGFGASEAGGSWSNQITYPRHLADIDGDGRVDIVGFGYNGVLIASGNSDGTFQSAQTDLEAFGASRAAGGWSDNTLYLRLLGDIDGNGTADIVGFGNDGAYVSRSELNWVG